MSDRDLSVKLRIEGDAKGATGALDATREGLDKVDATGQKLKTSTERLNDAFGKLGIRSARQIQADILDVNQALIQLANRSDLSGAEFDRAFAAGQARIRQLRAELTGASGEVEQVGKRADGMLRLMGQLGLAFSGAELARQFVTVNVELESMERTFRAITGSSETAAKEMDYARDVADRLGLPVVAAGKAYASLMASTKGTAVEGQATRAVFESVAHAMSVTGKSSADTEGALLALSQMASKGVVAMEELRGQLGERLPGALKAVADGFGLTTQQLIALVESGQLTAEELFPALAAGLDKLYGAAGQNAEQTSTLAQTWDRFRNSLADAFKTAGDAGGMTALKVTLEGLSTVVTVASVAIVTAGKDLGVFFAALANGDIGIRGFSDNAKQAFAEVEKEARDKLVKAAMHNDVLASTLDGAGQAALAAARQQAQAADEVQRAGRGAETAAGGITRLNVRYGELRKAASDATKAAEASAEAKKAEGAAAMALANAFGTETEKRQAKADAAQADANASFVISVAKREELTLARENLAAFLEEAGGRGKLTDSQTKQVAELDKLVAARYTEAVKAAEQARASAVTAAQAEVEAAALANNAARVDELRAAYKAAAAEAAALRAEKATGADVAVESADADIRAAAAGRLYRDALADQRVELRATLQEKQNSNSVDQAGVRLAIEQQRTALAVARARGNERAAIAAVLEIKRLEIKLAELTAQAKRSEAEAILLAVQAKREELLASGQLTPAKEAELKAQEAAAKVKKMEAEIASETGRRLRELADATRGVGDESDRLGRGVRGAADDIDRMGHSADSTADKLRRLRQEQYNGGRGSGGGGGGGGGGGSGGRELSYEDMKSLGLSDSEVSNILSNRSTSNEEKAGGLVKRQVNTQSIDHKHLAAQQGLYGADAEAFSKKLEETMAREMESLQDKGRGQAVESSEGFMASYAGHFNRAIATAAEQVRKENRAAKRTVEIKLPNGRAGNVDVASDQDADALTSILGQLESSASRSSRGRLV